MSDITFRKEQKEKFEEGKRKYNNIEYNPFVNSPITFGVISVVVGFGLGFLLSNLALDGSTFSTIICCLIVALVIFLPSMKIIEKLIKTAREANLESFLYNNQLYEDIVEEPASCRDHYRDEKRCYYDIKDEPVIVGRNPLTDE